MDNFIPNKHHLWKAVLYLFKKGAADSNRFLGEAYGNNVLFESTNRQCLRFKNHDFNVKDKERK